MPEERLVAARRRRLPQQGAAADEEESVPFFDEARVPIETIEVPDPQIQGLSEDDYEIIGQKVSYRLAQGTGSYVVLKYLRSVTKRRNTHVISCPPAPVGVVEGSRADVSFLAGLLEEFAYRLPLYRQHQRLQDSGIQVSRAVADTAAQQSRKTISYLESIYDTQLDSIRDDSVKAMDETPIKAGRKERGKMRLAYFWLTYGEHNEVYFPFFPSREGGNIEAIFGLEHPPKSVILTDGAAAYASYAKKAGIDHALCWSHSRREFIAAQDEEPKLLLQALKRIGAIYEIEEDIKALGLSGEAKQLRRLNTPRRERLRVSPPNSARGSPHSTVNCGYFACV